MPRRHTDPIKQPVKRTAKSGSRKAGGYVLSDVHDNAPMVNEGAALMYAVRPAFRSSVIDDSDGGIILHITDKPESKLTALEKMDIVEEGISKKGLETLKAKTGLDYEQLAQVLNVARATLINKKSPEKFNTELSDKIMNLAEIFSYGYEVFEDMRTFSQWLKRQNRALGGKSPFDLLHTSFGRQEVKNLLGRIDYGVYS